MKDQAKISVRPRRKPPSRAILSPALSKPLKPKDWPVEHERDRLRWFPARQRLIGLVRGNRDSYVLPPAVVRKASWRD